jgi:hypothetical protein
LTMKDTIFWDVMSYSLVDVYRRVKERTTSKLQWNADLREKSPRNKDSAFKETVLVVIVRDNIVACRPVARQRPRNKQLDSGRY